MSQSGEFICYDIEIFLDGELDGRNLIVIPLHMLVAMWVWELSSGASYTNSNFGGESLTVKVVSISGSDSADVKIYFGSGCTLHCHSSSSSG